MVNFKQDEKFLKSSGGCGRLRSDLERYYGHAPSIISRHDNMHYLPYSLENYENGRNIGCEKSCSDSGDYAETSYYIGYLREFKDHSKDGSWCKYGILKSSINKVSINNRISHGGSDMSLSFSAPNQSG